MCVAYRKMMPADYDDVISLWSSDPHIGVSESDERKRISRYLNLNDGCSFVAVDDDEIVGTVLAGQDGRRGFINHLFVSQEHRGQGIGRRLAELAEDGLAKTTSTKSYIFVKNDNELAIRFWQQRGYYLCDDFCTMRRSLSNASFKAYVELDENGVLDYLIANDLIDGVDSVVISEFGDGNMNHIFRVRNGDDSLIIKQSMPHGKIDVSVFEPVCRGVYEIRYVDLYEKYMPEMIENRIHSDETMALSVYRDYSGYSTLRRELMANKPVNGFGVFCGRYLARALYYSSIFGLGIERKKQLEPTFSNVRSRKLTEDYILISPFFDSPDNCLDDVSRPFAEIIWNDNDVVSVSKLLAIDFVSNKQCLIHGDFHPGNLFVGDGMFVVSDFDFASWGPIAYDIGTMIGNLVLSYRTQCNTDVRSSILNEMQTIFGAFKTEFAKLAPELTDNAIRHFCDDAMKKSLGYAGCTVAGRSYGYARFPEITSINDDEVRAKVLAALVDDIKFLMCDAQDVDGLIGYLKK